MIVIHVITSLERGGAQTSVAGIVRGLRARGIDAQIAFSSRGGTQPDSHRALAIDLARAGVPLHDVPTMRRAPSPFDALATAQLHRLFMRVRPSIVHTHASKAGLVGRIAGWRAGVPHVLHSVRGWPWHGRRGMARVATIAAERTVAHVTQRFVAVSHAMVDAGVAHGIAPANRFTMIRSGIELERFRSEERVAVRRELGTDAQPLVGTVMRLDRAKAPLDFVAVAARLAPACTARFLVVGDGALRADLERAVARAGLVDRFRIVGERDDVPALLAAMDVFVLPSRWEGMPRAIVEAAIAGVPIVATDVGGVREVVGSGLPGDELAGGLLCRIGDIDELAAATLRLLQDRESAMRLAARARAAITPEFALAAVVDRHVQLYADLVASRETFRA